MSNYMIRAKPRKVPIEEIITSDEFFTHNDEVINPDNSKLKAITWIDTEIEDEEQELFKRRHDCNPGKSLLQQNFRQDNRQT